LRLFIGDDWAEDHHDVEMMDGSGRRLAKARLPEGVTGMARLHTMIGDLQPDVVAAAYAASVQALIAVLTVPDSQVKTLQGQVEAYFGQHPAAETILSQPGLGRVLGARVLAEFGDDPHRYITAKARKNYAGTSPITRASGKKKVALARFVHYDRLIDALMSQAQSALLHSPGARAYYDRQKARGAGHNAALRQLANRLVGILHGCPKTGTPYNEHTAWSRGGHGHSLGDVSAVGAGREGLGAAGSAGARTARGLLRKRRLRPRRTRRPSPARS
jgi:hypothetical protein